MQVQCSSDTNAVLVLQRGGGGRIGDACRVVTKDQGLAVIGPGIWTQMTKSGSN